MRKEAPIPHETPKKESPTILYFDDTRYFLQSEKKVDNLLKDTYSVLSVLFIVIYLKSDVIIAATDTTLVAILIISPVVISLFTGFSGTIILEPGFTLG